MPSRVLGSVLVANRGEIALRVIRGCREAGLRSIAVHSDLDAHAPHVREADEALRVESYLDIDAVVAAALASGADAVHPGYGFLSERAAFARAVEEAGLVLVGPSAEVMDRMGRKDAAREIAVAADVPVVPSLGGGPDDLPTAADVAEHLPVLVKAAAGGGGKGMRIVRRAEDYDEALGAARREAASAFGDDALLVEKYVEHGRHVEVQVIGDHHGTVLHLFERDCSTQRRHQKVLEEAPAPTIDAATRERLTSAAVRLAQHVGYTNAGTVEFLLDVDTGEVYFLEMNTRLQVEHPVTELVTGLDLVRLQLQVAAGEPLGLRQDDVGLDGCAIEARVYAEDPYGGFLPQAGTASLVRWPLHARVDAALESGQVVSTSYDPMLGKVIVHGPDRETARRALVEALDETAICGITTNTGFLRTLAASDDFRDAAIEVATLDHWGPERLSPPDDEVALLLAAWTDVGVTHLVAGPPHPFAPDGWRLGADPAPTLVELVDHEGRTHRVEVDRAAGTVTRDGVRHDVRELALADHRVVVSLDGRREQAVANIHGAVLDVVHAGHRHVWTRPDVFADHGPVAGDGTISAPMPGTVLDVRVGTGDAVAQGQVLGTLEAMKMELTLTAPFAGTVTTADARAGQQVGMGHLLFQVEPAAEEA